MDSDPHLPTKSNLETEDLQSSKKNEVILSEEEDPYSFNGPYVALLGLAISFAMIGIPLLALLTEEPSLKEGLSPNTIDQNGSKPSLTIPFSRSSQSSS